MDLRLISYISNQVKRLWKKYDLQHGTAEFEFFPEDNTIFLSIDSINQTNLTVIDDEKLDFLTCIPKEKIYNALAQKIVSALSKFDPTDMYEILVGDEYDCPADFRRMLLEDSEKFSEKLLAIEAEL